MLTNSNVHPALTLGVASNRAAVSLGECIQHLMDPDCDSRISAHCTYNRLFGGHQPETNCTKSLHISSILRKNLKIANMLLHQSVLC